MPASYICWEMWELELHLVKQGTGNMAWLDVHTIFDRVVSPAGNFSHPWTVPSVGDQDASYALWLSGDNYPSDGAGYANLTDWFKIEGGSTTHKSPAGKIAGAGVGLVVAFCLGAAASVLLARLRRRWAAQQVALGEGCHCQGGYSDSVEDMKISVGSKMKEVDV
ncbi:hypothetical protein LTR56_019310 [Elasticomyces elasticus]|nr:hypothetical protein LTR56_019310 [Elasticomyces elasticus]KAK3635323.1 hypothetical protein LTR22_019251 [Elasticomyces elasticus]KAK5749486.1 hypothetical protein LTS12_020479 [Elasticomyces elasticus]